MTAESVLLLYSADFFDTWLGGLRFVALLELAGLTLAGLASGVSLRGIVRDSDRVSQVMVVAIVVNLAAYTFSATISGVDSARELAAVLPLGAVLAARLTAQRLIVGKLVPVVLAAVLGCAGILAYNAGRPPSPAAAQNVADWLFRPASQLWPGRLLAGEQHHPGQRRPDPRPAGGPVDGRGRGQYRWESKDSWYNPGLHDATFLVIDTTNPRNAWYATASEARATFGPPASSCNLGEYAVLIWNNMRRGRVWYCRAGVAGRSLSDVPGGWVPRRQHFSVRGMPARPGTAGSGRP